MDCEDGDEAMCGCGDCLIEVRHAPLLCVSTRYTVSSSQNLAPPPSHCNFKYDLHNFTPLVGFSSQARSRLSACSEGRGSYLISTLLSFFLVSVVLG